MANRFCLFVYGTLTDEVILKAVTGKTFQQKVAFLTGFRKLDIPEFYPVIVPDPRASVKGKLILDVDEDTLQRLDFYEDEGEIYTRVMVKVKTDDGVQEAFTYIGNTNAILKTRELSDVIEELNRRL